MILSDSLSEIHLVLPWVSSLDRALDSRVKHVSGDKTRAHGWRFLDLVEGICCSAWVSARGSKYLTIFFISTGLLRRMLWHITSSFHFDKWYLTKPLWLAFKVAGKLLAVLGSNDQKTIRELLSSQIEEVSITYHKNTGSWFWKIYKMHCIGKSLLIVTEDKVSGSTTV